MNPDSLGLEGRTIGNYVVDQFIGQGLTGFVYRAHAVADPQDIVALKFFLPTPGTTEASRETLYRRFEREAEILRQLHHPHILSIRAFGKEGNLPYLVLDYASEGTLSSRIAQGPLPLEECARLLKEIASGLDYAHSRNIIHRDIKPSNILLDAQGHALIADFSIAKSLDGSTTSSLTMGNVVGTLQYMSPEQSGSQPLTGATDVYSLGVVAYQMVTGDLPFRMDTLPQFFAQLLNQVPPSPARMRRDLPAPAEMAIMKALAKIPGDRFATPGAFADAFARGVRGEWAEGLYPQAAEDPTAAVEYTPTVSSNYTGSRVHIIPPSPPPQPWPRMRWFAVGVLAVLALALFSGGLAYAIATTSHSVNAVVVAITNTPVTLPTNTAVVLPTITPVTPPSYTPVTPATYTPQPPPTNPPQLPPTNPPQPTPIPTQPPTPQTITYDDMVVGGGLNQFNYIGSGWKSCNNTPGCNQTGQLYDGTLHWDANGGDYMTFTFYGTGITLYSVKDVDQGLAEVKVDGNNLQGINLYAPYRSEDVPVYTVNGLPRATHTLMVMITGSSAGSTTNSVVSIDRVDVTS